MSDSYYEIKCRDTLKKLEEVFSFEFDPLRRTIQSNDKKNKKPTK